MNCALDKIIKDPLLLSGLGRIGLVINQSSTSSHFLAASEVIYQAIQKIDNVKITCVFGPQHGYFQTEQDNMKETPNSFFSFQDGKQVPLYSLYSETREPLLEHLQDVDSLVIDLQDIGCRIYTYMLTLSACLKSASKYKKKILVLDRVNPLGLSFTNTKGDILRVEGNLLDLKWYSFVGWYKIPMRHGLSMGELGRYFIDTDKLFIDYKVITVEGLKRSRSLNTLARQAWVMPSPNIPNWESAYFFPAFVALEGTNISEGRGTTNPFQIIGAPWLNVINLKIFLQKYKHLYILRSTIKPSVHVREHYFRPTFNKYTGIICHGVQFHIEDPENINIFALGMSVLFFICQNHYADFRWKEAGYEYNFKDLPIHLILGDDRWYKVFEEASKYTGVETLEFLLNDTYLQAQDFANMCKKYWLYDE